MYIVCVKSLQEFPKGDYSKHLMTTYISVYMYAHADLDGETLVGESPLAASLMAH